MSRVTVTVIVMTTTPSQQEYYAKIKDLLNDWVIGYEGDVDGRHLFTHSSGYTTTIEMEMIADKLLSHVEESQYQGFDRISISNFLDGLRTTHPDVYRFSVGYFGGHDFFWRLK